MNLLEKSRLEINEIDRELVKLFEQRMHVVQNVAKYKLENDLPIFDANREIQIIEMNRAYLEDQELIPFFEDWYRHTMEVSKAYQKRKIEEKKNG